MIPSLVLVEIWQWTPLVMLIVLGGLASLPTEPYESALIDGASGVADVPPHHLAAGPAVRHGGRRASARIDALKAFDTIFVITQGGPGTASETINIYLYLQAFAFYNIGYASAVVVVFFVIIAALSLVLLWARQRTQWTCTSVRPTVRLAGRRRTLRRLGFALAVLVIVSPAILCLPLDAVALAQERARQQRLPAGVLIPSESTWDNYAAVFEQNPFLLYTWNSVIVSGVSTLVALLVGVPAGYGIAKARARGHRRRSS